MADVFTKKKRSDVMRKIGSKNTVIEKEVCSYLQKSGFRFRKHRKDIPGRPDLWLSKHKAAIFVNGCYWHRHQGCKDTSNPSDPEGSWQKKFSDNVARDERNLAELSHQGIRVLVVWGCGVRTKKARSLNLKKIPKWLISKSKYREIPPPK